MKKSTLAVATLLSALSTAAIVPVGYAMDNQGMQMHDKMNGCKGCVGCMGDKSCNGCMGCSGEKDCSGCNGCSGS